MTPSRSGDPEPPTLVDLSVLALLVIAAVRGALTGALRQLVSLAAAVVGVLAARSFGKDVGDGLARTVSPLARGLGPVLIFFGIAAVASLAGGLLLRGTGLARVVRGPPDRAAGALLGGAKAAVAAWLVLSAIALARELIPGRFADVGAESDFAALARDHNLVSRLGPDAARHLEKVRPLDGAVSPDGARQLDEARRQLEEVQRQQAERLRDR